MSDSTNSAHDELQRAFVGDDFGDVVFNFEDAILDLDYNSNFVTFAQIIEAFRQCYPVVMYNLLGSGWDLETVKILSQEEIQFTTKQAFKAVFPGKHFESCKSATTFVSAIHVALFASPQKLEGIIYLFETDLVRMMAFAKSLCLCLNENYIPELSFFVSSEMEGSNDNWLKSIAAKQQMMKAFLQKKLEETDSAEYEKLHQQCRDLINLLMVRDDKVETNGDTDVARRITGTTGQVAVGEGPGSPQTKSRF